MKDHGFNEWWAAWPKNTQYGYQRKGGKSKCLQAWIKGCYWTQAETIIKHTEWMKSTPEWLKDNGAYIPMPITYLNQQRWDGAELEAPRSRDPVMDMLDQRDAKAVPPSAEIRAKISELRGLTRH